MKRTSLAVTFLMLSAITFIVWDVCYNSVILRVMQFVFLAMFICVLLSSDRVRKFFHTNKVWTCIVFEFVVCILCGYLALHTGNLYGAFVAGMGFAFGISLLHDKLT